jgi:hypothetical protein
MLKIADGCTNIDNVLSDTDQDDCGFDANFLIRTVVILHAKITPCNSRSLYNKFVRKGRICSPLQGKTK